MVGIFKISNISALRSKIYVFVGTGFFTVAACDHFWVAIRASSSTRRLMEPFVIELRFLGVCSAFGNFWFCDYCADKFSMLVRWYILWWYNTCSEKLKAFICLGRSSCQLVMNV